MPLGTYLQPFRKSIFFVFQLFICIVLPCWVNKLFILFSAQLGMPPVEAEPDRGLPQHRHGRVHAYSRLDGGHVSDAAFVYFL